MFPGSAGRSSSWITATKFRSRSSASAVTARFTTKQCSKNCSRNTPWIPRVRLRSRYARKRTPSSAGCAPPYRQKQRAKMTPPQESERILIFDFGAQYGQLIARRVREQNVFAQVVRHDLPAARVAELRPRGLI